MEVRIGLGSGRNRESPVWDYFKLNIGDNTSTCAACTKILKGKNTTNLVSHLESFHKKEYAEYLKKKEKMDDIRKKPALSAPMRDSPFGKQLSISASVKKQLYEEGSPKYTARLDALVRLFAKSGLSTTLIENASFREFVSALDPLFQLPG